jgi:hypothetical protein
MKKAILIFTISPILLFGQTSQPATATVLQQQSRVNAMNNLLSNNTSSLMLYYKPSEVDIKGSKYFHNDYVTGELWFTNGEYASTEYVYKFDEAANSVQVKDKKGEEILVDVNVISGCKLSIEGKNVYYFRAQTPGNPNKRQLFQLIYNSENYKVIKLPSKSLINKTKIFHDDAIQYEYLSQHTYYLKKGDKKFEEIKLKKKDLLEFFPEKKALLNRLFDTPPYKEKLNEASFAALLLELENVK